MIHYVDKPTGLDFHNWIDVFLDCQDGDVFGNYTLDNLRFYETSYLHWLDSWNIQEPPEVIKEAKGIGAWWRPETVIIVPKIFTPGSFAKGNNPWGNMYWWYHRKYRRLRPYNECHLRLLKLYRKRLDPGKTYITPQEKTWMSSELKSKKLFHEEMKLIKPMRIIYDNKRYHEKKWRAH